MLFQLFPIRDLVTHIYGNYVEKPNIGIVTKIAKILVEKYPFMSDSVTSLGSTSHVV